MTYSKKECRADDLRAALLIASCGLLFMAAGFFWLGVPVFLLGLFSWVTSLIGAMWDFLTGKALETEYADSLPSNKQFDDFEKKGD